MPWPRPRGREAGLAPCNRRDHGENISVFDRVIVEGESLIACKAHASQQALKARVSNLEERREVSHSRHRVRKVNDLFAKPDEVLHGGKIEDTHAHAVTHAVAS